MNGAARYWVWMQGALGAGKRCGDIINAFGGPRGLYESPDSERYVCGLFTLKQVEALSRFTLEDADRIIAACDKNGWTVLTPDMPEYPARLKELAAMPMALYVSGDVNVLSAEPMISIVGTRNVSAYGAKVASGLAYSLARAGFTVVSGGAIGVDSIAHRGAMSAGGRTVAVLGCGLGSAYLRQNEPLRREIAANGALVSEFMPFTGASKSTFPMRNRIISGISPGTVVVEAGVKSGSLITAHAALEQGRDVFAVPGDVTDAEYSGTNGLIRDGATPVFSSRDVMSFYAGAYPRIAEFLAGLDKKDREKARRLAKEEAERAAAGMNSKKSQNKSEPYGKSALRAAAGRTEAPAARVIPPAPDGISAAAASVYKVLSFDPSDADEVCLKTGLNAGDVLAALTELELFGAVTTQDGKKFFISGS